MSTIIDVYNAWQTVDLRSEAVSIIQDQGEIIADLNASQLAQGIKADGTEITPQYAESTIEYKQGKTGLSGITDRVTLFDSGDFYRGIAVTKVDAEKFTITSIDDKTPKLEAKYGNKIFGLTSENSWTYAVQHFMPRLASYIYQKTGLTLK